MNVHTIGRLKKEQEDLHYVKDWKVDTNPIPIYHVDTVHAFNRVIGYARYINATAGTVLYRGQTELHSSLLPSGTREGKTAVSETLFENICADPQFSRFLGLDRQSIKGWKEYNHMLIEAVLQHYGAKTFCMDFVDNHWCALWFGFNEIKNNHYRHRNDKGSLYVFLYVAETEGPCVSGMYIGESTYTVDLRKALPSTFQRPASQHGWIVRSKERKATSLDNRVVGIVEISVDDAREWLGNGELLSEENFFPSFSIDQGYKVLLSRQQRSGLYFNNNIVLPQNTICNYHLKELLYCSDFEKMALLKRVSPISKEIECNNLMDLFSLLFNTGWDENTCDPKIHWDETRPYIGQSAATAILTQRWFGGDICSFSYSDRTHYFNIIDGIILDLTWSELQNNTLHDYYQPGHYTQIKPGIRKVHSKYEDKVKYLIENCKKK